MDILVVEDVPTIAMILVEYLEDTGHTVMGPASTAKEALRLCEDQTPDLAILDLRLEDGSSGLDVARELVGQRGVATIVTSGELTTTSLGHGTAVGFLQKPYGMADLRHCMEAVETLQAQIQPQDASYGPKAFAEIEEMLAR